MIKFFLDETAVGLYAVAVKLSEIWYFIPAIICTSLFPAIINSKNNNELQYKIRLNRLYIFLGVSAVLIALPVTLLAVPIITLLFGTAYLASAPLLQIYVWSGVGLFLMTGINRYLMAENYLKSIFIYSLISVVTNIILNIIFIPQIGLLGAAWATLVSYLISPIIVFILSITKRNKHSPNT
jgi:O-antigen/teichoic acid export membrane protein